MTDSEVSIRRKELLALLAEQRRVKSDKSRHRRALQAWRNGSEKGEPVQDGLVSSRATASYRFNLKQNIAAARAGLDRALVGAALREQYRQREYANGFDPDQDRRDEIAECWGNTW